MMHRRPMGLSGVMGAQAIHHAAGKVGEKLAATEFKHIEEQVESFRVHLTEFAAKHRNEINKDPAFRLAFAKMTKDIGVDPLLSTKGFWGEALGLSTFYRDLAVQIVDVCLSQRDKTGGLISISELTHRVVALRGGHVAASSAAPKHSKVSRHDVMKAIEKLAVLGGGYRVVLIGSEQYVLSVPYEMDDDQTTVLRHCETLFKKSAPAAGAGVSSSPLPSPLADNATLAPSTFAWTTVATLTAGLGWDKSRAEKALLRLLQEGMAWVDNGHATFSTDGYRYYFPAINAIDSVAPA